MNRISTLVALFALTLVAACGDDTTNITNNYGNGGTEAPAGPANQVDATVSGGSSIDGAISGEAASSTEGQFYAAVAGGFISVWVGSGTSVVNFVIDAGSGEVPGSFSITEPPEGNNLTVTNGAAILNGTGGSVSIDYCPNQGAVITGSFNNVALTNVATMAADGTLTGSYRATVVASDGSVTCVQPTTPDTTDAGGSTCAVDSDSCDGPCCPYVQAISQCSFNCTTTCIDMMNPSDMSGCAACFDQCVVDSGAMDDAACAGAITALNSCEESSGCDDLMFDEGDAYDQCLEASCCAEYNAAF